MSVIVKFNPTLYPQEAVEKAANDFRELCRVTVEGNTAIIDPTTDAYTMDTLVGEFKNYVLGLVSQEHVF